MIPEVENDEIIKQTKGRDYLLSNKNSLNLTEPQWEDDIQVMTENVKNSMLTNQNKNVNEKSDLENDVQYGLLNGINLQNHQTLEDNKLINGTMLHIHKSAKECARQDSCRGLLDTGGVLIGPRGQILTRENTVVAGCTTCTGGRLISCARIKCTSTLCWQQTSKKPSGIMIGILLFLTLLSIIGIIILCFTNVFSNSVLSNMALKNNSLAHNLWKNPPVHPLMKVHIFNYTNAEEVMAGKEKKFKVQDLGPYTYRETLEHVNEEFNPNGTLTFQFKRSYQFMPNKSVGLQFDRIVVPNLPLLSTMSMVKESYFITQMAVSAIIQSVGATAFRPLPAHRFLWGYDDELITLAKPILNLSGDMAYDKFGILVTKNGTSPDKFTINTGENDLNMLGVIDKLNGKDKFDHWGTEECNRVDATDGSLYPVSMLDRKQTLYVFNKDLCRRFPLTYVRDLEVFNGIPALRYSPPKTVFDHPSTYHPNQCYCHMDSGACPPRGVFNSSPCAFGGAPAFASFPHFYLGDPELLANFEGLEPNAEKHDSYIDIHPTLGLPLGASSKMQINIQVRKSAGITGFDFLPDELYLPVAWFEVDVSELPQEIRTLVYHATFSAHQAQLVMKWVCVVTLIICGIFLLVAIKARISADVFQQKS